MKKFLVTLFMIFVLSTASYGASEDIYVRQDVFDAKMEALFVRLHGEITSLSERMEGNYASLSERMDKNLAEFKAIANEIKGDVKALDARISNVESNVSWWIGGVTLFLTALALVPLLMKLLEKIRVPQITLEDVMRLIEENNARMAARPQGVS